MLDAPQAAAGIAAMAVFLDPGRDTVNRASITPQVPNGRGGTKQCNSSGAATNDGYAEHAFNWAVIRLIQGALDQMGVHAVSSTITTTIRHFFFFFFFFFLFLFLFLFVCVCVCLTTVLVLLNTADVSINHMDNWYIGELEPLELYDFGGGQTVAPVPDIPASPSGTNTYLSSHMFSYVCCFNLVDAAPKSGVYVTGATQPTI